MITGRYWDRRRDPPRLVFAAIGIAVVMFSCAGPEEGTAGPAAKVADSTPRTVAQKSLPLGNVEVTRRALCVIDDSADMVGRDGVNADPRTGEVPMFAYLLPQLQCTDCLPWSRFEPLNIKGAIGIDCNGFRLKKGALTMTSLLAPKILQFIANGNTDETVIFVTNGLDWETRGGDAQFRMELDVGAEMCEWLRASGKTASLGVAADRSAGYARRPLVLFGFGGDGLPALRQGAQTPPMFAFRGFKVNNPATWIRKGAIAIRPAANVKTHSGRAEALFTRGGEAEVHLMDLGDATLDLQTRLSASVGSDVPVEWLASVDDAEYKSVESARVEDGSYEVRIPLGNVPVGGRALKVRLGVAPVLPAEVAEAVPAIHSMRRSVTTLGSKCRAFAPVRVDRTGASTVPALSVRIVPGERR
jgi:hypothetical protein